MGLCGQNLFAANMARSMAHGLVQFLIAPDARTSKVYIYGGACPNSLVHRLGQNKESKGWIGSTHVLPKAVR
ncbi:MAG: hypothetical protein CL912_20495 [Deltaproteobacteria bacterium]|nr:hypothetical protein [Deltaproteobacteria bacterium]|tara:strand:- start:2307 stop:2522 length:216 start_codon:yes stop_codon:yes gene_type:complete